MRRLPILLLVLVTLPAAAFDIEKWADDLANRQMEKWKREKLQAVTKARDPKDRLEAVEGLSYTDADALMALIPTPAPPTPPAQGGPKGP